MIKKNNTTRQARSKHIAFSIAIHLGILVLLFINLKFTNNPNSLPTEEEATPLTSYLIIPLQPTNKPLPKILAEPEVIINEVKEDIEKTESTQEKTKEPDILPVTETPKPVENIIEKELASTPNEPNPVVTQNLDPATSENVQSLISKYGVRGNVKRHMASLHAQNLQQDHTHREASLPLSHYQPIHNDNLNHIFQEKPPPVQSARLE